MALLDRITTSPDQEGGLPCIRATGIRVAEVTDRLSGGVSESEILTEFPDLFSDDIRACLEHKAIEVPPVMEYSMPQVAYDEGCNVFQSLLSSFFGGVLNVIFEGLFRAVFQLLASLPFGF